MFSNQANDLLKKAYAWYFAIPNPSRYIFSTTVGIDSHKVICLSSSLLTLGERYSERMAINYHKFVHQMEAENSFAPPLIGLTTNGNYFNLYVGASNVITDFFTAHSASSNMTGIFYLKECVKL